MTYRAMAILNRREHSRTIHPFCGNFAQKRDRQEHPYLRYYSLMQNVASPVTDNFCGNILLLRVNLFRERYANTSFFNRRTYLRDLCINNNFKRVFCKY